MNPTDKFAFDKRTQEILERLSIPFAIYQFLDNRIVTIAISCVSSTPDWLPA